MKSTSLLLLFILILPLAAHAEQKTGFYGGLRLGLHNVDTEINNNNSTEADSANDDTDISLAFFAGYDWSKQGFNGRTELEYGVYDIGNSDATNGTASSDLYEANINAYCLMLNQYFDLENSTDFTPYIGGGIGVSRLVSKLRFDDNANYTGGSLPGDRTITSYSFAWNLNAGVTWELTDTVALDLQGRYLNLGSLNHTWDDGDLGYEATGDLSTFSTTMGMRFNF